MRAEMTSGSWTHVVRGCQSYWRMRCGNFLVPQVGCTRFLWSVDSCAQTCTSSLLRIMQNSSDYSQVSTVLLSGDWLKTQMRNCAKSTVVINRKIPSVPIFCIRYNNLLQTELHNDSVYHWPSWMFRLFTYLFINASSRQPVKVQTILTNITFRTFTVHVILS